MTTITDWLKEVEEYSDGCSVKFQLIRMLRLAIEQRDAYIKERVDMFTDDPKWCAETDNAELLKCARGENE